MSLSTFAADEEEGRRGDGRDTALMFVGVFAGRDSSVPGISPGLCLLLHIRLSVSHLSGCLGCFISPSWAR